MHKQHEDQPSNELPNLSTWHRVPVGATIPKGTPYAYTYDGSINVELGGYFCDMRVDDNSYYTHYTEHPITPPLSTEDGATILVSSDERPPHILVTLEAGRWVNHDVEWPVSLIRAWAPVTIGETVVIQ